MSSVSSGEIRHLNNGMRRLQLNSTEDFETSFEHWVYGFWFKNKHMRRLARDLKLTWKKSAFKTGFKLLRHVWKTARVHCAVHAVEYRGRNMLIMTFMESHGGRDLHGCKYSPKQMDRVRKAMGLPRGTKPKWYEVDGLAYASGQESDSEDEESPFGYTPLPVPKRDPDESVEPEELSSDEDNGAFEAVY